MFSQVSVILSTGGQVSPVPCPLEGCPGVSMSRGKRWVYPGRTFRYVWWRWVCLGGEYVQGMDMSGERWVCPAGWVPNPSTPPFHLPPDTTGHGRRAGSTHPTGKLSCFLCKRTKELIKSVCSQCE